MKIFFRPEQVAATQSYSPSAGKPAMVIDDWNFSKLISANEIQSFDPVTLDDMYRAHSRDYIDGIMELRTPNGFENFDESVAKSLPYTSGSMFAAAKHAATTGEISCSPTSGFHHAGYDFGGGFCTVNGLMVAALKLLDEGVVRKVGILDCDYHYGNGTDHIINKLGLRDRVVNKTMGGMDFSYSSEFFPWLSRSIRELVDCDVVLYQAGADAHENDPLGGFLTSKEMIVRDDIVFSRLRKVAWNLAGGYQRDDEGGIRPVLQLHRGTLVAARKVENNAAS